MAARSCAHNNWEDLRGRKQCKCLRCVDCGARWQVILAGRGGWCKNFHRGVCVHGAACTHLHVTGRGRPANALRLPQAALVVSVAPHAAQDDSIGGGSPGHDAQSSFDSAQSFDDPPSGLPVSAQSRFDSALSFDDPPSGLPVSVQSSQHSNAFSAGGSSGKSRRVKVRMTGDSDWNQLELVFPDQAPWAMTNAQLDAMLRAHGMD